MLCDDRLIILQDVWNAGFYSKNTKWTNGSLSFNSLKECHEYVKRRITSTAQ